MPASPRGGLYGPLKDWFEDDLDLSIAEGVEIFEAPGKGALGSIRDCVESLSQNYKAGRLPPA